MPPPDPATLARRAEIVAAMRAIVPGEGVIDALEAPPASGHCERWVEGTYRDEYQNSKFTLAVGQPQLWMANLRGCPRVGKPRIKQLPMQ